MSAVTRLSIRNVEPDQSHVGRMMLNARGFNERQCPRAGVTENSLRCFLVQTRFTEIPLRRTPSPSPGLPSSSVCLNCWRNRFSSARSFSTEVLSPVDSGSEASFLDQFRTV